MRRIAYAMLFVLLIVMSAALLSCGINEPLLYNMAVGQSVAMINEGDEPPASVTIMEVDDYGRILFNMYKQNTFYDNKTVFAYFICQYKDDNAAYCYPDVCYELEYGRISKERLQDLKDRNDWNRELDYEKCKAQTAFVPYNTSWKKIEELFFSNSNLNKGEVNSHCVDVDIEGKELHVIVWHMNSEFPKSSEYGLYLMIVDACSDLVEFKKVDDPLKIALDIVSIKGNVFWKEKLD